MKWRKSPDALVAAFTGAVPADTRVERRKMFGCPCVFAGGNMFAGLHQENMILRLPEPERGKFLRLPGAKAFEPMPGRLMKEYVVVPPGLLAAPGELRAWLKRSLDYAVSLPAKKKAAKRTAGKGAAGKKPGR